MGDLPAPHAAPCYFTRVDLSDALGQRLIRLQKRREKRREAKVESLVEWWNGDDLQEPENNDVLAQDEEEDEEEFVLSPGEQELAAQMAALGLPTVLGGRIKRQSQIPGSKKKRKSKKAHSSPLPNAPSALNEEDGTSPPVIQLSSSSDAHPAAENTPTAEKGSLWQPVWDSEHGAFYWCNSETLESQWEVPDGLEAYAAGLYAFGREESPAAALCSVGCGEQDEIQLWQASGEGQNETSVPGEGHEVGEVEGDESQDGEDFETGGPREGGAHHLKSANCNLNEKGKSGDTERMDRNGAKAVKESRNGFVGGTGAPNGFESAAEKSNGHLEWLEGCPETGQTETRPSVSSFELRGRQRPCGKHIRFEEDSDASDSGVGNGVENGVPEKGAEYAGKSVSNEPDETVADLMEVDDPMEIDSFGGVRKLGRTSDGGNGATVSDNSQKRSNGYKGEKRNVWGVESSDSFASDFRTEAVPGLSQNSNRASGGERALGGDRASGDAFLGAGQAAALGGRLLEAAKERSSEPLETSGERTAHRNCGDGLRDLMPAQADRSRSSDRVVERGSETGAVEQQDAEALDAPTPPTAAGSLLARQSASPVSPETLALTPLLTSPETSAIRGPSRLNEPASDATRVSEDVEKNYKESRDLLRSAPGAGAGARIDPEEEKAAVESLPAPARAASNVEAGRAEAPPLLTSLVPLEADSGAGRAGASPLLTSAAALEADAGAGGDAGRAVLVASASGQEKPADVGQKYWFQRYRLFSRFDQGVRLDPEGWYSVTPEAIAAHHAKRCSRYVVIDAFAGVGGNAIQMATTADWVIAVDLDPGRLALAEHNAGVYGVRDKIEFVVGDFFQLAPHLRADALFLSPPWGGPEYSLVETYDLDTMLEPVSGVELFKAALQVTSNIALFLPRNVDVRQLQELAWLASPPLPCEIESNYLCGKLKCRTAYYGNLVVPTKTPSLSL